MKIYSAPLQGYTDSAWRTAHAAVLGDEGRPDAYFAPFLRVEKGAVRQRDVRDLAAGPADAVPQIIFRDTDEFNMLVQTLVEAGHSRLDLNLGCPFPPQCHKGRGAAMIGRPDVLRAVAERMNAFPGVSFSAKMRLGLDDPSEWRAAMPAINAMPLTLLTVHPRTARQQYRGALHTGEFAEILEASAAPVVYNGDVCSPADIAAIGAQYPAAAGIMTGRGLLASPWLIAEYRSGRQWSQQQRLEALLRIHSMVYEKYETSLCGEASLLSKLTAFWEYPSVHLPSKTAKAIRKSRTLAAYRMALSAIEC